MAALGELERSVMEVLWAAPAALTVRDVAARLDRDELAYTTVMTVLDRLARKGVVDRERHGRAWAYTPAASRDGYVAGLMLDALDQTDNRGAALVRFARSVSGSEAEILRAALHEPDRDRR